MSLETPDHLDGLVEDYEVDRANRTLSREHSPSSLRQWQTVLHVVVVSANLDGPVDPLGFFHLCGLIRVTSKIEDAWVMI